MMTQERMLGCGIACLVAGVSLGAAGCGRMGFDEPTGAPDPMVAPDAAQATALCLGDLVRTCFATPPMAAPLLISDVLDVNTDSCDQGDPLNSPYCVILTGELTVTSNGSIRAHGARPLVLVSTGTIHVLRTARIDVSSMLSNAEPGAGANPMNCTKGNNPNGAGGGYGGSFQGRGGQGKKAMNGTVGGVSASGSIVLPGLRGGCGGGNGGSAAPAASGGDGLAGAGGGAVALVAAQIELNGIINASGAAGHGGSRNGTTQGGGGGGGGSGGMIILDGVVTAGPDAQVFANGGGGGEGGNINGSIGAGTPGRESTEPTMPGRGGVDPTDTTSGDGGDGAAGSDVDGKDPLEDPGSGGGGGGGGGAGFIYAPGVASASVSPPSSPRP